MSTMYDTHIRHRTGGEPAHTDFVETESVENERIDWRELLRLHPRLLMAAGIVALLMIPVGIFVAALGVWVLELSGGAARDTGIVVAVAGFLVSDFWGGGLVATLTRARAAQVAVAWTLARLVLLLLVALVAPKLAPVVPVQLLLAIPASYAGARVSRKQASLRRHIAAEQPAPTDTAG